MPLFPQRLSCSRSDQLCNAYLGTRTTTTTSTASVTGTGNIVIVTQPDTTDTVTEDDTVTDTVTNINTETAFDSTTITSETVTTATSTIYQRKRDAARERAAQVPSKLKIFAASLISSACSCIVTPATITKVNLH